MITLRKSGERGRANFGWLDSQHTFSFGSYYDPQHMGVSYLRVINDDRVKAGFGFDTHGHKDMEIISYVLEGSIEHKDTMHHIERLTAGDVQVMSAGTGVKHSEYNASDTEELHFLQIWIMPEAAGLTPRYQQKNFNRANGFTLLASRDGREGSLQINQNADLYRLRHQKTAQALNLSPYRLGYLHVARGGMTLNGQAYEEGDGITVQNESSLEISVNDGSEVLFFDLPELA
jgi:redox-sensitive bicupin YhaK (pirin superfamily)